MPLRSFPTCCGNGNNLYFVIMFLFSKGQDPVGPQYNTLYCSSQPVILQMYWIKALQCKSWEFPVQWLVMSVSWLELVGSLYAIQSIIPAIYGFQFYFSLCEAENKSANTHNVEQCRIQRKQHSHSANIPVNTRPLCKMCRSFYKSFGRRDLCLSFEVRSLSRLQFSSLV